jgi:hypothetical protein
MNLKLQGRARRAATFIQDHMTDRFFDIGGRFKNGWVMQHAMRIVDERDDMPAAWRPSEIRAKRIESYAWQNVLCDSRWPDHGDN